jgi:uncharacterized membrane protein
VPEVDGRPREDRRPALLVPGWVPVASTVICLLAVADAGYLTYVHFFTKKFPFCVMGGGLINCGAVTTSIYSKFLGMPVSLLGLLWAVGMLVLCSPPAWKASSPWVGRVRLLGCVTGLAMVFWLVYAELFKLGKICEYCTGVHILTVALFVVVAYGMALATPAELADETGYEDDGPETGPKAEEEGRAGQSSSRRARVTSGRS